MSSKTPILWRNLKIWWIFRKKSGKNIIISYLRSKLSILWRNMVKTIEIWRFEKNHKKKDKKNEKKKCVVTANYCARGVLYAINLGLVFKRSIKAKDALLRFVELANCTGHFRSLLNLQLFQRNEFMPSQIIIIK